MHFSQSGVTACLVKSFIRSLNYIGTPFFIVYIAIIRLRFVTSRHQFTLSKVKVVVIVSLIYTGCVALCLNQLSRNSIVMRVCHRELPLQMGTSSTHFVFLTASCILLAACCSVYFVIAMVLRVRQAALAAQLGPHNSTNSPILGAHICFLVTLSCTLNTFLPFVPAVMDAYPQPACFFHFLSCIETLTPLQAAINPLLYTGLSSKYRKLVHKSMITLRKKLHQSQVGVQPVAHSSGGQAVEISPPWRNRLALVQELQRSRSMPNDHKNQLTELSIN